MGELFGENVIFWDIMGKTRNSGINFFLIIILKKLRGLIYSLIKKAFNKGMREFRKPSKKENKCFIFWVWNKKFRKKKTKICLLDLNKKAWIQLKIKFIIFIKDVFIKTSFMKKLNKKFFNLLDLKLLDLSIT